ncbi:uncharacterized protein N7477_010108 [Penicillium maclennaniae]|uniref:uncharacterized protein n=1 Tax=Penicillium maclennaniae TaxID=1343394 RepID=UPI002540AD8F|nr:uncharacterized protein N7477_010108 [Penicillium maclennaniae]KAJ5662492.1 hypothetical protein N7477_010108 [Penicillium maclennaniae]
MNRGGGTREISFGLRLEFEKMQSKFKMSQEKRVGDREGVAEGFTALGGETGEVLSKLIKERGVSHDARTRE